jgi:hypothetical protein
MSGQTSKPSTTCNDPGSPSLELLYTEEWAIDTLDRLLHGDLEGARATLSYANINLMKLPPGASYEALEAFTCAVGVKLYQTLDRKSLTT